MCGKYLLTICTYDILGYPVSAKCIDIHHYLIYYVQKDIIDI